MDRRISWNEYFARMAKLISLRSPCNRLHVGCVIVKDKRIVSSGYNGYLPNSVHESIIEDNHEIAINHSEMNAVANACRNGVNLMNSTAYITHYPCIHCFKMLVASGIKEIIYLEDYRNSPHVETLARHTNVDIKKY
jgi:dCMP deaminase